MAETLHLEATDKAGKYRELIPQLQALVSGESDNIANLSNVIAALKQAFGFFWVGVYIVKGNELVLGPFQGPIACTRIRMGKGVCGTSWERKATILVPDVDQFPGHIACSSASRSEIVVPVLNASGEVIMVIDVDSDRLNDFDTIDQQYLEEVAQLISNFYHA
jgi:GAF domain-containing protein